MNSDSERTAVEAYHCRKMNKRKSFGACPGVGFGRDIIIL